MTKAEQLEHEGLEVASKEIRTIQELDRFWAKICYMTAMSVILPSLPRMVPELQFIFEDLTDVLDSGDVDQAIDDFDLIVLTQPTFVAPRHYYAEAMYTMGQTQEAQQILDECLQLDESLDYVWYFMGNICLDLGDWERALTCFQRAVEINPDRISAHNDMIVAYLQMRNLLTQRLQVSGYFRYSRSGLDTLLMSTSQGASPRYADKSIGGRNSMVAAKIWAQPTSTNFS